MIRKMGSVLFLAGVGVMVAFSAMLFVGCGDDMDDDTDSGGSFVCADGEIWVYDEAPTKGLVFKNGKLYAAINSGQGQGQGPVLGGTYSGTTATLINSDGSIAGTANLSVSGNKLTMKADNGVSTTLTKITNQTITLGGY